MNTGYHYTSAKNWSRIAHEGMHEYPLNKPEITELIERETGIFVFVEPTEVGSLDEIGCVLFQSGVKHTLDVVCLAIHYTDPDIALPPGYDHDTDTHSFVHTGSLGPLEDPWVYHEDREMEVLYGPICPDRIHLTRSYNVRNLLTQEALVG